MVKVTAFYAERDEGRKQSRVIGAALVQLVREGEPVVVRRSYKPKGEDKYKHVEVAKCIGGRVDFRAEIRLGDKGEFVGGDILLTFEEKQQILDQAAELAKSRETARPSPRRFG